MIQHSLWLLSQFDEGNNGAALGCPGRRLRRVLCEVTAALEPKTKHSILGALEQFTAIWA